MIWLHIINKVKQLRNENNALEVDISALLPANLSEKMQLQDEINKLRKDKQYLAAQLNTITKNNKDLSRGYFPYTEVTKKIYNCISIQEISHLRNLFRRNKWDEIIKPKNIAVILRLIVGIDNDAIPICNPQTSNLTSEQRYLIHTLKSSSPSDALNIIRNKVLTVTKSEPMFINELPFCKYSYTLGQKILDYTSCERDLGILINERLDWHEHHDYLLKKGYQMLGMTKRTCHFIFDRGKKRMLYLTLVRSNFEHCSTIWRPVTVVDIRKFEALQKRAIKWINCEEANSYSDEIYAIRCRQVDILPLQLHFELNDLIFFYKIIYELIPVSLPAYISPYSGDSRLRNTRMDDMSYVVNDNTAIPLNTAHSNSIFFKSFFYRTIHIWNSLPLSIRKICTLVKFKLEVKNFLWNKLLSNNSLELG